MSRDVLPNFIIAGAQKAGTTSLHHYLSQHPDIYMAPNTGIHFFDKDENYQKGVEWYQQFFAGWNGEAAVGEKNTEYFHPFEEPPERIYSTVPDIKLIFVLRNPIDRAYSHYWHNKRYNREPYSFEKALRLEKQRIEKNKQNLGRYSYKYRGKYIIHLKRFSNYFSKDKMLFILTEDLKNKTEKTLHKTFKFLGVQPTVDIDDLKEKNIGGKPRSTLLAKIAGNKIVQRMWPLPALINKINIKKKRYPAMNPETRKELEEIFTTYNKQLQEFTGLQLTW